MIVYFHGGGWVIGSAESDDALCRDMANQTGAIVVSCDYRHAPEHRFPASHDDAWAALLWAASTAEELGGDAARLAVAGWSAGANLAAHVAQRARDEGGPALTAQLLITPVVDCDQSRGSYVDNADGYVLTAALMKWFWDHEADPDTRTDPRLSPLRAENLADLPPAVVITCEFDPLRDEGTAYVEALRSAGVHAAHVAADGQIHTSIGAVSTLLTPTEPRHAAFDAFARHLRPVHSTVS